MKLFLKISLGLIGLIFIIVLGFVLMFNPNDYKDDIITFVNDKTGRSLSINGDISLSLFPWIGLDLGETKISNAKGFGHQPFAKMSHLQVRAKLWPLFSQRLEADTLVLEGLTLNLAKNKQGISNWDDLTAPASEPGKAAPATSNKKPDTTATNKNLLAAFALNGIKIINAQFNWHDQQQKQKVNVSDVNLSMGKLRAKTKIPFKIQFHLKEKSVNAKVNFESDILFSSNFKQFSFYNTNFSSDVKLVSLKKHLLPQINSALMQIDLDKQTFDTKNLSFSDRSLKLETQLSAKQISTNPYIKGHLNLLSLNPRTLAENFEINLPDMADKTTLTRLSAQLNIKGTLDNISLSNLKLALDDTNISGKAKIKPSPHSSSASLSIDDINLDRYLPEAVSEKKTSKAVKNKTSKQSTEAILIPVALLSRVNLDADFKVKKLQIKKTHWTDLTLVTHSKNGRIQIKPLSMQGYAAKIQTDFNIKTLKNDALLSGNLNIQKIKAGKLLNDFIGKDKLKGVTTITASFNTTGIKLSQLKQNLSGKLKFNLTDGTLKGYDLDHQKKVLDAKIKRQPIPVAPVPEETKIANLSASAIIKKGILTNKDLRASTPLARIIGAGSIDLAREKINYVASVKFTSSTKINPSTSFEKMNSLPLDVRINGTFDKPSIKVDFQKTLNALLNRELKKQERKIKSKIKKDVQKELEKKLGDKLKKLLKF